MTEPIKPTSEAAVPNGTAASAASPASTARPAGGIVKALLLSLFVCPGFGHRHLGRTTAGWIVLALFLASFAWLGFSLNQFVQTIASQLQEQGSLDFARLAGRIDAAWKNAPNVGLALDLLLTVYLGAPLELLFAWFFTRKPA